MQDGKLVAKCESFAGLLEAAARFHGHVCSGQVIGVRMAMAGLRELGISDPRGRERKDFVAIVEIDRCATDAILSVTGLTPGKRSLKVLDHGKMAATFVHLITGKAVRISALDSSMDKAAALAAEIEATGGKEAYLQALAELPEHELFSINEVVVRLEPGDLPGPPVRCVVCAGCGETVLDCREVVVDGKTYCKSCASGKAYYTVIKDRERTVTAHADGPRQKERLCHDEHAAD